MAATSTKQSSTRKSRKGKDAGTEKDKKDFQWTDDESELLLNITHEYKVSKAGDSIDWESVKNKYEDIFERFVAELPDEPPSAEEKERVKFGLAKDFPHTKGEVTKQVITTKLKAVRQKYRQAVDSGRRSGHGRVVLLYYELCEKVWGGSPATEQLESGLESRDLNNVTEEHDESENLQSDDDHDHDDAEKSTSTALVSPTTVKMRRQFLDKKLSEHRQDKLKRKLPVEVQLLDCAQEDIKIKRRLVEQMDNMDKQYAESIANMSKNMEKLSESIGEGFSFLKMMFMPTRPPVYPNAHFAHPNPHFIHTRPSTPSSRPGTPSLSSGWDD